MKRCTVVSLGRMDYLAAWDLQRELHRHVVQGSLPDLLLLLEHPHVYTAGRRGRDSDILISPERLSGLGAEVHYVDRGGEVTYHGPGQLVGYAIFDVRACGGPLRFVRALEAAVIATLAEFGIAADREDRPTGVWVADAKIAAIGLKISRGFSTHGFALNVDPDLSYFDHIVPCGIPGSRVTSLAREGAAGVGVQQVVPVLAEQFGKALHRRTEWADLEDLRRVMRSTGVTPSRA